MCIAITRRGQLPQGGTLLVGSYQAEEKRPLCGRNARAMPLRSRIYTSGASKMRGMGETAPAIAWQSGCRALIIQEGTRA